MGLCLAISVKAKAAHQRTTVLLSPLIFPVNKPTFYFVFLSDCKISFIVSDMSTPNYWFSYFLIGLSVELDARRLGRQQTQILPV